jgi:hypothetical protein
MVRTEGFHPSNPGSIPGIGTWNKRQASPWLFRIDSADADELIVKSSLAKRNCAGLITHRSLDRNQELLKDALII